MATEAAAAAAGEGLDDGPAAAEAGLGEGALNAALAAATAAEGIATPMRSEGPRPAAEEGDWLNGTRVDGAAAAAGCLPPLPPKSSTYSSAADEVAAGAGAVVVSSSYSSSSAGTATLGVRAAVDAPAEVEAEAAPTEVADFAAAATGCVLTPVRYNSAMRFHLETSARRLSSCC